MISALQTLVDNGLSNKLLKTILEKIVDENSFEYNDDHRMCVALLFYLENEGYTDPDNCSIAYGNTIKVAQCKYLILTDDEADTAFDDHLEQSSLGELLC